MTPAPKTAEDASRSIGASLVRGSAFSLVTQVASNVGLMVSVLIIARELGPDGRGAMAFVVVTAMLTARFVKLGVPNAALYMVARLPERRGALLSTFALFGLVSATIGAGLVALVLIGIPSVRPDLITPAGVGAILLGVYGAGLCDTFYGYLLGARRFGAVPLFALGSWLYVVALAIVTLSGDLDVTTAAYLWSATQLLNAVMLLAACLTVARPARPDAALMGEALRFGIRAWPGSLASFANYRVDQWILVAIKGVAELGIYAVAVNVSEILLYIPSAAATALTPTLTGEDRDVQRDALLRAMRSVTLVTLVAVVCAALLAPPLIPLVFGGSFSASVVPFLLLLPGAFGWTAVSLTSSALVARNAPGRSSIGISVALVTGVVLDLVLMPPFGASGAAAASSAAFLAGGVAGLVTYRKLEPFDLARLAPARADLAFLRRLVPLRTTETRG